MSSRTQILWAGAVTAVCLLVPACFYLARAANVNSWDSDYRAKLTAPNADELPHIYDSYPLFQCEKYHDPDLVVALKSNIEASCEEECKENKNAEKQGRCLADCRSEGTNWSTLFMVHGVTLLLMSLAFVLISIGSHVFYARVAGVCLNWWMGCAHIAAIIMTGIYRFDDRGRLAMNCLDPSEYRGEGEDLEDAWTFRKDG